MQMTSCPSPARPKTAVVIVGALVEDPTNHKVGGVVFASRSLLESPLSEYVNWRIIDTTMRSTPPPGVIERSLSAFSRVVKLLIFLIFSHVDSLLIFGNYEVTSFLEKGLMCILGRLFRKRVVLSIRTEVRRFGSDWWFMWFRRMVAKSCNAIICQGETPARLLVEILGIEPEKTVPIKNWINLQRYQRPQNHKVVSLSTESPTVFLFVGHLSANKAPDVLLRAANILKEREVDFRLVLCGNGPLYDQLQQDIRALELSSQVILRGWVVGDELLKAYWDANVFVLPTYSEGMPNAMLEAMAAGLPVIVTPVSSIPDVVTEGENGLFTHPGDPLSLADVMETLAMDVATARRMGEANLAYIQQEHNIEYAWPRIAEILGVQLPRARQNKSALAESVQR